MRRHWKCNISRVSPAPLLLSHDLLANLHISTSACSQRVILRKASASWTVNMPVSCLSHALHPQLMVYCSLSAPSLHRRQSKLAQPNVSLFRHNRIRKLMFITDNDSAVVDMSALQQQVAARSTKAGVSTVTETSPQSAKVTLPVQPVRDAAKDLELIIDSDAAPGFGSAVIPTRYREIDRTQPKPTASSSFAARLSAACIDQHMTASKPAQQRKDLQSDTTSKTRTIQSASTPTTYHQRTSTAVVIVDTDEEVDELESD